MGRLTICADSAEDIVKCKREADQRRLRKHVASEAFPSCTCFRAAVIRIWIFRKAMLLEVMKGLVEANRRRAKWRKNAEKDWYEKGTFEKVRFKWGVRSDVVEQDVVSKRRRIVFDVVSKRRRIVDVEMDV